MLPSSWDINEMRSCVPLSLLAGANVVKYPVASSHDTLLRISDMACVSTYFRKISYTLIGIKRTQLTELFGITNKKYTDWVGKLKNLNNIKFFSWNT